MNIKIPVGKRLIKIFWFNKDRYFIPTICLYIHEGEGFIVAFKFLGLNIEFWSYNIFKKNNS